MTEILHNQLSDYLQKPGATSSAVYLIQGEPILVEQCVEPLIEALLQGAPRQINCEVLDGAVENIPDIMERMNTYAMTAGPKIVWFKEARLFDSGGNQQRIIDQIQEALESDQLERAAKGFVTLCTRLGVDALSAGKGPPAELEPLEGAVGENAIVGLSAYCRNHGISAAASDDYLQALAAAVEKGFPLSHFLIITAAAKIPKNRKLYKSIQAHGLIVDCNVPQGERRSDKIAQEAVLRQILESSMKKAGKRMHPARFASLIESTGFDPATFRDNIEKLIDYVGQRDEITASDIETVVRRTKNDPLFELTNAVADRNPLNALFYLQTLLNSGWHALQMLAALTNQIRKLIVAKDFTMSEHGKKSWRPGMTYPQFQSEVMPAVQAFDARISEQVKQWTALSNAPATGKDKSTVKKDEIDLALASNPGNAYPAYQTFLKSEKFQLGELVQAMVELHQTDVGLKSSGQDPTLLMKKLIMSICGKSTR